MRALVNLGVNLGINFGRGVLMGAADLVPGVSGGTVALVLGIYGDLLSSLRGGARAMGRSGR